MEWGEARWGREQGGAGRVIGGAGRERYVMRSKWPSIM